MLQISHESKHLTSSKASKFSKKKLNLLRYGRQTKNSRTISPQPNSECKLCERSAKDCKKCKPAMKDTKCFKMSIYSRKIA